MKKRNSNVNQLKDEQAFHRFAMVLMILLAIYCVIPFFLMLSISFSSESSLSKNGYCFFPKELTDAAYDFLWVKRYTIGRCYALTILVTVVGTVSNLVLTSLFAYPLSRKDFKGRNFFAFFAFFTVMFNGGLTANYIVWTQIFHVKDTLWAYILPGSLLSAMNILMVRNYFSTIS